MAKNDKVQIDFNLDKAEIPNEARPYRFPFKGKNFETVNLAELTYEDMESALGEQVRTGNSRPVIDLFLGEDAKRFWELKPTVWHIAHLSKELTPIIQQIVGDVGESGDSETK